MLGLTGALLVHKDAWVMLPHAGDAQVIDTGRVVSAVEKIMADPSGRPTGIIFANETFGLHKLTYNGGAGAYADQAGNVVTRWQSQWQRPEIWLFDFHHHLFAGDSGEVVIGVAGLCGLFFVISGTILWWRTRRTFAFRIWPKRMTRSAIGRQHRDLGMIMAPLLVLSLYTGVTMVFRSTTALVLGPSAPALIDQTLKAPKPTGAKLAASLDWGAMIRTARQRFPDAEIRGLSLPRKDSGLITLRLKQPAEWLPNGRTTFYFTADTGRLVASRDALKLPAQVRGYNLLYPLHAAEVGGLAYRLVMTVSGLALTLLGSLTVWAFWFKRRARPIAPGSPVLVGAS